MTSLPIDGVIPLVFDPAAGHMVVAGPEAPVMNFGDGSASPPLGYTPPAPDNEPQGFYRVDAYGRPGVEFIDGGLHEFVLTPRAENIVFSMHGVEMLRIESDGFFVKGVKINDDPEGLYAAMVRAFKGGA